MACLEVGEKGGKGGSDGEDEVEGGVEGSKVKELVIGDVDNFEYRGHLYAAKQPGQFLIGAAAYFFLHTLGISYTHNFLLASALVTFLTASLIAAVAVLIVLALARALAPRPTTWGAPLLVALGYAIGTTAFPYSGIEHHDLMATGFLIIAFYLFFKSARMDVSRHSHWLAGLGGVFLGLIITTSMLPALMVAVVALYSLSHLRWISTAWLAGGAVIGLVPLFAVRHDQLW